MKKKLGVIADQLNLNDFSKTDLLKIVTEYESDLLTKYIFFILLYKRIISIMELELLIPNSLSNEAEIRDKLHDLTEKNILCQFGRYKSNNSSTSYNLTRLGKELARIIIDKEIKSRVPMLSEIVTYILIQRFPDIRSEFSIEEMNNIMNNHGKILLDNINKKISIV